MGQISKYLRTCKGGYMHYCPGCKGAHMFAVTEPFYNGARWTFDGNSDKPTFSPSMNIVGRCHYLLKEGMLQFLGDCNHELAGKIVPLPELPLYLTDHYIESEKFDDSSEPA